MLRIKNDIECLDGLHQSKEYALSYLIDIYFPVLSKYAYNIVDNDTEAEDIATEIFIKVWEKKEDFNTFGELKAFLYVSTKNACLNKLRSREREKVRHHLFHDTDQSQNIDEFIYEEMLAEIRKSIAQLPTKMQQIFILSYFNKMTNEQIAEHLNLSHQTIRNQKAKALKTLRTIFRDKKTLWILFLLYFA